MTWYSGGIIPDLEHADLWSVRGIPKKLEKCNHNLGDGCRTQCAGPVKMSGAYMPHIYRTM